MDRNDFSCRRMACHARFCRSGQTGMMAELKRIENRARCIVPLQQCIIPFTAICLLSVLLMMILGNGRVFAQGGAATAAATRPVTANDVNRVSRNLYCPVCQNVPLEVCETTA